MYPLLPFYPLPPQTEEKIAKNRDKADIDKLNYMLDEKNTYMHYFKNEEAKGKEKEVEATKSNVK